MPLSGVALPDGLMAQGVAPPNGRPGRPESTIGIPYTTRKSNTDQETAGRSQLAWRIVLTVAPTRRPPASPCDAPARHCLLASQPATTTTTTAAASPRPVIATPPTARPSVPAVAPLDFGHTTECSDIHPGVGHSMLVTTPTADHRPMTPTLTLDTNIIMEYWKKQDKVFCLQSELQK